jgi:hypothetical protein
MSNETTIGFYTYKGSLGEVVPNGISFFASKHGFPIGIYSTFEEAMVSLVREGTAKAVCECPLFADECRCR